MLTLLPVLAITNGMLFMIKGGILSGAFYLYAGLVFLAIFPMVWFPRFGPLILALPSAVGFFATGLQYHRRQLRSRLAGGPDNGVRAMNAMGACKLG